MSSAARPDFMGSHRPIRRQVWCLIRPNYTHPFHVWALVLLNSREGFKIRETSCRWRDPELILFIFFFTSGHRAKVPALTFISVFFFQDLQPLGLQVLHHGSHNKLKLQPGASAGAEPLKRLLESDSFITHLLGVKKKKKVKMSNKLLHVEYLLWRCILVWKYPEGLLIFRIFSPL